jgi:hypothetical protein
MNRRSFLKWLGIGVPAATVAAVVVPKLGTSKPKTVSARLGEWHNYYSEGDPELMAAIENWKSHPYYHTATLPDSNQNNGYSTLLYDKELVANLRTDNFIYESFTSRRLIPVNEGMNRQFFTYNVKS